MTECYVPSQLDAWWASDTWLMMDKSGCTVTWWPIISIQILLRPSSRTRVVSQKDGNYPERMAGLGSKILRAHGVSHLLGPEKGPQQPP